MADITFSADAHYGFQNHGSDYWLGYANGTVYPASNSYQWRLVSCSDSAGPYYIEDWTSYQCLFTNSDSSVALRTCTSDDASWTIAYGNGQDDKDGYTFSSGSSQLLISADNDDVVSLGTASAGSPTIAWSVNDVDEEDWVNSPGPAPDLCAATTTAATSDTPVSANNYVPAMSSTTASITSATSAVSSPASTSSTTPSAVTAAPASETTTDLSAAPSLRLSSQFLAGLLLTCMIARLL